MFFGREYESPLGKMILASSETSLIGVWFEGQKYIETEMPADIDFTAQPEILRQTVQWLDAYYAGEKPDPSVISLAPQGGEFRQMIWQLLLDIPYGEVTTYGDLARKAAAKLGKTTMSAQAVGGAVGHNPISIVIPCHRVIGSNGSLTGYAGGVDRKQWLLNHEGVKLKQSD